MELWALVLCVLPTIVTSITISPNGNSPEIKMIGGMMVDVQKEFTPMNEKTQEPSKNYGKRKLTNSTKLSINERYRRLIPYMTFYYANDLVTPTTESPAKNVEVEKAEIIEAKTIQQSEPRQPKKIVYSSNRNIPVYQGNRLTQFNIASANPTKLFYKEIVPAYANPVKITPTFNPLLTEQRLVVNNENFEFERFPHKQIVKSPSVPFSPPTRRPYLNLYNSNDDAANVQYYFTDKNHAPRYKLVPYEQTPPVKVSQNENLFNAQKLPTPVPVLIPKEHIFIKPRPARPQFYYENINIPQSTAPRKQPTIVSESYYEKVRPQTAILQPIIESGFKPIVRPVYTTEAPIFKSTIPETPVSHFESEKQEIESPQAVPEDYKPNYYQYVVEQSTFKPPQHVPSNTVTLADLLNTLQLNKSIPKPITKENVGTSIRTLLQVLNALKAAVPDQDVDEIPVLSTPKPFIPSKVVEVGEEPIVGVTPTPIANEDADFHDEQYLAPVIPPSQHIDDFPTSGGSSQRFPLPITSDDEGGTPGRPGVDYPILTIIPPTAFDCKTQRYKGFFADPETRCQVWHYCDLNGGQASFLCPNGTIFSQAGLTCDWWFNVKCASTAQLYVLNESLYKYILPHSPKFPEDYSGPLVDKYLTLKFKEMEEQFKKNKNKQSAAEKMDSEDESSTEDSSEKESESSGSAEETDTTGAVSEASVIVGNAGATGNVERLQD